MKNNINQNINQNNNKTLQDKQLKLKNKLFTNDKYTSKNKNISSNKVNKPQIIINNADNTIYKDLIHNNSNNLNNKSNIKYKNNIKQQTDEKLEYSNSNKNNLNNLDFNLNNKQLQDKNNKINFKNNDLSSNIKEINIINENINKVYKKLEKLEFVNLSKEERCISENKKLKVSNCIDKKIPYILNESKQIKKDSLNTLNTTDQKINNVQIIEICKENKLLKLLNKNQSESNYNSDNIVINENFLNNKKNSKLLYKRKDTSHNKNNSLTGNEEDIKNLLQNKIAYTNLSKYKSNNSKKNM